MMTLKGITWDHPRGYAPLRKVAELWKEITYGNGQPVMVEWTTRSLKDFGDYGLETLAAQYDLLIIDHPHMGTVAAGNILLPLDEFLPKAFLDEQARQSVGPSFESYLFEGHHWALPVDAAAQVAACREDLLAGLPGWANPADIDELETLLKRLPRGTVAIPLCATDCWCTFLTLCAQHGGQDCITEAGIDAACGQWAFNCLLRWKQWLHRHSLFMNPVQLLERMVDTNEIAYAPFTFGYSNYSRSGTSRKRIQFIHPPGYDKGERSSLLGGAGIAVSAKTQKQEACFRFLEFLLSPVIQSGLYYTSGGQPAHLQAWQDERNNADSLNFFANTLDTLQRTYVRPRYKGFPAFQEKAGDLLHKALLEEHAAADTIDQLNEQFKYLIHASV
jgi:multiple sugar transport system substrate-binding protein